MVKRDSQATVHGVPEWDMAECRHVCIRGTTTARNALYYKHSILSHDINMCIRATLRQKKKLSSSFYSQRNWDSMKLSEFVFLNHMISKKVKKKKKRPSDSSLISCLYHRVDSMCSSTSLVQIFMPADWVKDVVSGSETIVVFPCETLIAMLTGCTSDLITTIFNKVHWWNLMKLISFSCWDI